MKTSCLLLLSLFTALTLYAQTAQDIKAQINEIKKNKQYLYADITAETEQDAKDLAEDMLQQNINEWVATQKKLRNSANIVISNKRELWAELKMPRGNMYRSFIYVKKADIQGTENTTVIENTHQVPLDPSAPSQVEEIFDFKPTPTLAALMTCKKYEEFATLLKQKKTEGKVSFYDRYAALEHPEVYFLAVYNRAGEMVAFLTPGPQRINAATHKADDVTNYAGCGAIGFQVTDK